MFFIQQTTQHDCGFTALKILLANLNKDENYLYLTSPFPSDRDVSLLELIEEAKNHSLILKSSRAIDKSKLNKNDQVPFIAVINNEGNNHAVYLYKINDKYVYYYDPIGEFKRVRITEFIKIWTGDFLRVESFNKKNASFKKPNLVKTGERIVALLFTLFSASCSLLGIYFINKNAYIFLPAIFLSLMIISELVLKRYLLSLMKKVDKRMEDYYDDIKDKDYRLFHNYLERYKSSLLLTDVNFYVSFLITIIIAFIMLINDKINIIYIGVNILLGIVYSFIVQPLLQKKALEMERREGLLEYQDRNDAFNNIATLRKEGYRYGSIYTSIKYIFIFIQIVTAFIMMMSLQIVNVTYIICYSVMEIYFYNHFVSMFEVYDKKDENNNLLAKLLALFEKKE